MERIVLALDSAARLANAIAIVAGRKPYEAARRTSSSAEIRSEVVRHIDEFASLSFEGITDGRAQLVALKDSAVKLKEALLAVPESGELAPTIVAHARVALVAFGVPEPAGGWDDLGPGKD